MGSWLGRPGFGRIVCRVQLPGVLAVGISSRPGKRQFVSYPIYPSRSGAVHAFDGRRDSKGDRLVAGRRRWGFIQCQSLPNPRGGFMLARRSAASIIASMAASSASACAEHSRDSGSCCRHSSYSARRSRMPNSSAVSLFGRDTF